MLEHEAKEVHHLDKGFDEVNVNFAGIKSLCGKCGSPFSSKSQLYKYLEEGCMALVQTSLFTSPTLTLPIPIIESKTIIPAMRSGLVF